MLATFAIPGHRSVASFAIGPLYIVPFGFPSSSLRTTAALSSNCTRVPSGRLYSFRCLTIIAQTVVFLMSGLPRITLALTRSPTPAAGLLPLTVLCPLTLNIFSIFAPLLSHVGILDPRGRDFVMLALIGFILFSP